MSLPQLRIAVRSRRIASISLGSFDPTLHAANVGACGRVDRFLTSSNIPKSIAGLEAGICLSLGASKNARRCERRFADARSASFVEFGVSTRAPSTDWKTTKQSGSAPSERIVSFDAGGKFCRPGVAAR
ncbi:MAG: hypothetical protein WB760_30690 [Xanthobacteraceae bacterium]